MSEGPQGEQIRQPADIDQLTRQVDEIIPILAHGVTQQIEERGLRGKVKVQAIAGDSWSVGASKDNLHGIANVITYPRDYLTQADMRVVNARLRHEIGNLNYPFEQQLNQLSAWAHEQGIPPRLVTSLAQVIHGPSVDYLEMRNSHSSAPEENFRALYESEINVMKMASSIGASTPYRQALDIVFLEGLASTGICSRGVVDLALQSAHPSVREQFTEEFRQQVADAVKTSNPQRKATMIREAIFPKVASLATIEDSPQDQGTSSTEDSKERHSHQEITPEERLERQQAQDLLSESLQQQLQNVRQNLNKLQQPRDQSATDKPETPKAASMKEMADQAKQMQEKVQEAMQQAKQEQQNEIGQESEQDKADQLKKLEEQLKELQELAEALEQAKEEEDEEPINFNITEHGIDETQLAPEQLDLLKKTREFAQKTSRTYRKAMRVLMSAYQRHNPNFTDEIIQKMMDRGYDLPAFDIYSPEAAQEFFSRVQELGIEGIDPNDFLVNFNLPRPLGRFWYRGGTGKLSQPVPEGAIEWGEFYRRSMPVIWNGVDEAAGSGLILDRLNSFGQHDPKNYYYLWEAVNAQRLQDQQQDQDQSDNADDESHQEEGQQEQSQQSKDGQTQEGEQGGQQSGDSSKGQSGQGESGQQGSEGSGAMGQPGQGEPSGMSESEQMQSLLEKIQQLQNQEQSGNGDQASEGQQGSSNQQGKPGEQSGEGMSSGQGDQPGEPREGMPGEGQPGDAQGGMPSESPGGKGSSQEGSPQTETQSHDSFQQGGTDNARALQELFSRTDSRLRKQLDELNSLVANKFTQQQDDGSFNLRAAHAEIADRLLKQQSSRVEATQNAQIGHLDQIKHQQEQQLRNLYQEMSGLDGEALTTYIDYMEETRDFTDEVTEFFVERFNLEVEYQTTRDQLQGSRLQKGFQRNIMGMKDGRPLVRPTSFERRFTPDKPVINWTLIIDNSGSCGGEIIEQEKRIAVALAEVAKRLQFPLEILTFGGNKGYVFLKTFEQDIAGAELQRLVMLNADQGTPDVPTLEAACASMRQHSDRFTSPNNFVYFMTDGQSGEGSIQQIINQYRRDMVITGIGLAGAANTIQETWGSNALPVENVSELGDRFIRKIEQQIEDTFD